MIIGKNYNHWFGDCIPVEDMIFITYKKEINKEISCQTDLCNSPVSVQKLSTGILCSNGFYL
jgi:hypothetical protein